MQKKKQRAAECEISHTRPTASLASHFSSVAAVRTRRVNQERIPTGTLEPLEEK